MTMMTDKEIRKYLAELEESSEITLKELVNATGWLARDLTRWMLEEYDDRKMTKVRTEKTKEESEDNFLFPGKSSYPVFRVGEESATEPEPPLKEEPFRDAIGLEAQATRTEILVPVDTLMSYNELYRMLAKEVDNPKELIEWWQTLGHALSETPTGRLKELYGDTMYRLKALGSGVEEEVTKIVMHKLPRTTWYVSRKGGLYDYLEREFGWSRSQAVEYFRDKLLDDSDRKGLGLYQVPIEIPIETKMLVTAREVKPLPELFQAVLRWQARPGGAGSKQKYSMSYEIDAFMRLPRGMDKQDREQALADLTQAVLDAKNYPGLDEILDNDEGWHGHCGRDHNKACWMGTTTTGTHGDGDWEMKYMGMKQTDGTVAVNDIYDERGVSVWGR